MDRAWTWFSGSSPSVSSSYTPKSSLARFICTICTCRIWWSCQGLTSVSQWIHWMQLKHLLLRHMYNLSLLNLCATLLVDLLCWRAYWQLRLNSLTLCWPTDLTLYCAVLYIVACVDVSRTVFRDHSVSFTRGVKMNSIRTQFPGSSFSVNPSYRPSLASFTRGVRMGSAWTRFLGSSLFMSSRYRPKSSLIH